MESHKKQNIPKVGYRPLKGESIQKGFLMQHMPSDKALLSENDKNLLMAAFISGTEAVSEAKNICLNVMGLW